MSYRKYIKNVVYIFFFALLLDNFKGEFLNIWMFLHPQILDIQIG